jgi:hypothetical protein
MKVIKPALITAAMLVSSTVAEPSGGDPAAWSAVTAYAVGDLAWRATTHRIYKRLVAGTTATLPEADLTGAAPNWLDYAPTNRWAMFDDETGSHSSVASPLTVAVEPGICNSLALIELVGASVTITMTDGAAGPTVYSTTVDLSLSVVADWYAYFFEPFRQRGTVVLTDLPPYLAGRITVTLTGVGTVKCGGLIVGTQYAVGRTEYGASAGIRDYSRKLTDEATGVTTLEKRRFAKIMRANLRLQAGAVNAVQTLLTELRATPCVWIGDDDGGIEPLTVFGWFKDFSLTVSYPTVHHYSLEIEGMT